MEYKKILNWILLGCLIFNNQFTSKFKVITREMAQAKYIENAQLQTGFWQRVKNFGKAEKIGLITTGAGTAAAVTTKFLYYDPNVKYDKQVLKEFADNNETFSLIFKSTKDIDLLFRFMIVPSCDLGQDNGIGEYSGSEPTEISYGTLRDAIYDTKNEVELTNTETTRIAACFSRLSDETKETITQQKNKINDINEFTQKINTSLTEMTGEKNLQYFGSLIKKQYKKEKDIDIKIEDQKLGLYISQSILNEIMEQKYWTLFGFKEDQKILVKHFCSEKKCHAQTCNANDCLVVKWVNFFPEPLNLTDNGNVKEWAKSIENAKKYLFGLSNFCSEFNDIEKNINKNNAIQKFCKKYFSNTNLYKFIDTTTVNEK